MSTEGQTPPPKPEMTPNPDERQWAMLAHLSGLIATLLSAGGLAFLGPLIVWLVKKDQSPFVGDQAKEALNFQIAVTIAAWVSAAIGMATCGIGFLLLPIIGIGALIYSILGGMEANKGVAYRYPYTIRLVK